MTNKKYVFVYSDQSELCETPDQAIAFVNRLYLGQAQLTCNPTCQRLIHALYEGDIKYYPQTGNICSIKYNNDVIPGFNDLATTGCCTTRIKFFTPLADTLEEHNRISKEMAEKAEQDRLREAQERFQQRIEELSKIRRGWYGVKMYFYRWKTGTYSDLGIISSSFVADSGYDAYQKVVELSKQNESNATYPQATSSNFWFEFLSPAKGSGTGIVK